MKLMTMLVLLSLPLRSAAEGAGEDYADAGLVYTAGSEGYAGLNLFAEWGDDLYYLRPSLSTYSRDDADRYTSYSFSGGIDRGAWSISGGISLTPETGGYSNAALYSDLVWSPLGEPEDGSALEDLYLGVFAGLTAHEDLYASSTTVLGTGRRSSVSARTSAFTLSQYDYGVSASLRLLGVRVSGRYSTTSYDKDVTEEARALPIDIGAIGSSGFPDSSVSARLSFPVLPLSPWAGYSRTRYLLAQPSSEALQAGASVRAGPAEISAGWETLNPGGGAERGHYYSLGLSWSF